VFDEEQLNESFHINLLETCPIYIEYIIPQYKKKNIIYHHNTKYLITKRNKIYAISISIELKTEDISYLYHTIVVFHN